MQEGRNNPATTFGEEYPRMMYRKTDVPEKVMQTDSLAKCGESSIVVNSYEGLLCDTRTANDPTEMEQLLSEGYDTSPAAAHGKPSAQAIASSAKDEEIARLRAQLQQAQEGQVQERRGPGRPPKAAEVEAN